MPEFPGEPLPFDIAYHQATGEVVVWMTYGYGAAQTKRRQVFTTAEDLARAISDHRWESFLQARLATALSRAAVAHLDVAPGELEAMIRTLAEPGAHPGTDRTPGAPAPAPPSGSKPATGDAGEPGFGP